MYIKYKNGDKTECDKHTYIDIMRQYGMAMGFEPLNVQTIE
jgi:hypothetical protein